VIGVRRLFGGMTMVLALLSLLLAALLYWQWQQQLTLAEAPAKPPAEKGMSNDLPKDDPIRPFVPLPVNGFREITERPLFTEGRLPPEKPVEEVAAKLPPTPLLLTLEGVVITPQSRVAVITDLQTKETLRLAEGMSHSDWKVEKVEQDEVTIKRGKEETVLALQPEEEPAASGVPKLRLPFRAQKRRPPPVIPGK